MGNPDDWQIRHCQTVQTALFQSVNVTEHDTKGDDTSLATPELRDRVQLYRLAICTD